MSFAEQKVFNFSKAKDIGSFFHRFGLFVFDLKIKFNFFLLFILGVLCLQLGL